MIKTLLVHLPSDHRIRPVTDGAISIAKSLGASIDAVSVGYEMTNVSFGVPGGAAVELYEMERENAQARADAASAVFEAEASNAGLAYKCRSLAAIPAEAAEILSTSARLSDLAIVSQPDFDHDSYDNSMALDILFGAGGPVLFIPYTHRGHLPLKRIGIAWDGSRLASRAVRDSMPFLTAATDITIIAINENPDEKASAAALRQHLACHGLSARIERMSTDRGQIQPIILSLAADLGLELIAMGGYGHSRLQERLLGGVTRAMLEAMTVPTLMSH